MRNGQKCLLLHRGKEFTSEMMVNGEGGGGAVVHPELGEDNGQMMGHGALADAQLLGNAAVALALRYQTQDLDLTIREASGQARFTSLWGQGLKSMAHQSQSGTRPQLLQECEGFAHRLGIPVSQ